MRVTRWNDALAVQIPDDVARSLDLKEGDEVVISPQPGESNPPVSEEERQQAIAYIKSRKWTLPEGWKFDRDEANER